MRLHRCSAAARGGSNTSSGCRMPARASARGGVAWRAAEQLVTGHVTRAYDRVEMQGVQSAQARGPQARSSFDDRADDDAERKR